MKFRKVGGQVKYVGSKDLGKKGNVLVEGVFLGESPNKFRDGAVNFEFRPEEGPIVSLSDWKVLRDDLRKNVKEGDRVRVVYEGKQKAQKSGAEYHNFSLYVADLPLPEVAAAKDDSDAVDMAGLE